MECIRELLTSSYQTSPGAKNEYYEPGLEHRSKSAVVGSSIREGIPRTTLEVGYLKHPQTRG